MTGKRSRRILMTLLSGCISAPIWVHFGAGNIFRGFPARLQEELVEKGLSDKGIIVGEGFDYQIISDIYDKYDNLTLLVTLKANGSIDKRIVGTVTEAYPCAYESTEGWNRFKEIFASPSLQMISFTITEKGYALKNPAGEYFPGYVADFAAGPGKGTMFLSRLTELLLHRYNSGKYLFRWITAHIMARRSNLRLRQSQQSG